MNEEDTTRPGTVLTLGSGVTIDESGDAEITDSGYSGDGIVDQGTIRWARPSRRCAITR